MTSLDASLLTVIIPVKEIERIKPYLLQTLEKTAIFPMTVILSFDVSNKDLEFKSFLDEIQKLSQRPSQVLVGECNSPGLARNRALQEVKTDWVTFWDSDDLPDPESVMKLTSETMSQGKAVGVGKFEIISSEFSNQTLPIQQPWSDEPFLDIAINPGIWRFVFNTKRINKTVFPAMLMGEDQVFLARLNLRKDEMNFSELVTYRYLKHSSGQLTSSKSSIQEIIQASILLDSESTTVSDSPLNMMLFSNQILTGLLRTNSKTKMAYLKLLKELSFGNPEKIKRIVHELPKLVSRKLKSNG